ncbi:MAG: tandem-95 repeat protein [Thiobacillaceae bacterium]
MKRHRHAPQRPQIEELEPRLLFSADLAPVLADSLVPQTSGIAEMRLVGADGEFTTVANNTLQAQHAHLEVVFLDLRVQNHDQILADIQTQNTSGRSIEVVLIDPNKDGIAQISDYLSQHDNVDAVHIISHGSDGSVQLGSGNLDFDSLAKNATRIKNWGNSLTSDADILLYGCDVAENADGKALVDALSRLTGADVAASTNLTGNAALGGDWVLEYQSGTIQTQLAVSEYSQQNWDGVLAITSNSTVTSAYSANTTSLSWSQTVNSGANRAMFVEVAIDGLGANVTGVTYGGVALTQVGRSTGNHAVEIWELTNPTVGTANVVVSFAGNTAAAAGATTFNGVNQTTPYGVFAGATGTGTTASVNVVSTPGDQVLDVQYWKGTTTTTDGAGQTAQWAQGAISTLLGGSTIKAGAAMVTMSGTNASSAQWEIGAVSIMAAPDLAPSVTTSGSTLAYTENAAATVVDSALTVSDIDSINLASATVSITSGFATGQDTLAFTNQNGITGSWNASTGVMTLSGSATVAKYQTALRSITYVNGSDNPSTTTRTVSFIVNDGTSNSNTATRNISVTAVNDAPVLADTALTMTVAEDAGAPSGAVGSLVSAFTGGITDPDGAVAKGIAIVASNETNGTWYYSTNGGTNWISIGTVSSGSSLLLADNASTRLYFSPAANYNGSSTSALTLRAWDQTSGTAGTKVSTASSGGTTAFSSATDVVDVTVTAVNDPPVIGSVHLPFINEIHYDNVGTDTGEAIEIAAAAGTNLSGWSLVLYNGATPGSAVVYDTLALSGIITDQGNGYGTLSFAYPTDGIQNGGNDAIALVDGGGNVIQFLSYEGVTTASGGPANGMTSTDIGIAETGTTPVGDSLYLTGSAGAYTWAAGPNTFGNVNTGQSFAGLSAPPPTQQVNEDTALIFSTANGNALIVSDPDADAGATDPMLVTLSVSNGALQLGSTTGLTGLSGNNSATVSFAGSVAEVNAALNGLRYLGNANFNGSDALSITVNDQGNTGSGGAKQTSGSVTLQVNPVNDAPTATNLSAPETYTEDTSLNLINIVISDVDSASVTATLTISNVTAGSLSTATSGAVTSTYNAGTGVWTASGAIANVNTLLAGMNFTPAANYNGNFSIATSVSDGSLSVTGSKTMTGIAVNDAPTITNGATPTLTGTDEDTTSPGTLVSSILTSVSWADVDSGAVKGIAITSTSSNGTWQYSTDGISWTGFGSVSTSNALLLTSNTQVRYVPDGSNGETATFGFKAWDQTTGTPSSNGTANHASTSGSGGSSAFSSGTATASMTITAINDAPTSTITPASYTTNEGATLTLGGTGMSVSDVDASNATVQVTLSVTSGVIDASAGFSGVSISSSGTAAVTLSGTISQINNLLSGSMFSSLSYTSNTGAPLPSDTLTMTIDDQGNTGAGGALTGSDTATIFITPANGAPTLDNSRSPTLTAQNEDDGAPVGAVGTLVSSLVDFATPSGQVDNVTDPDSGAQLGIAITAASTTNGTWFYSTNNGANWNALGAVANNNARLLSADAVTRIYFQSNANYNGTIANAITFRAWDQTSGSNGVLASTSSNGGATAFSSSTDTGASLTVNAVNDAPVLDNSGAMTLTTITEDDAGNTGQTVASVIASAGGNRITDVDASAVEGIAVVSMNSGNGQWQYSLDNGTSWNAMGSVSDSAALLLRSSDLVRFVPDSLNGTTGSLTFHAWDQTSGVAGGSADISAATVQDAFNNVSYSGNNGATNWSGSWVESDNNGGGASGGLILVTGGQLEVKSDQSGDNIYRQVNLSGATTATLSFDYTNLIPAGTDVIAVQISGNGGSSYTTLTTFTQSANTGSGTLTFDVSGYIASNTRVRFIVTSNDKTAPVVFDNVQVDFGSKTGGSTAFSLAEETASITVNPVNDAPVLADTSLTLTVSEDAGAPSGAVGSLVSTFTGGISDVDSGALKGIAITATNETNGTWYYSTSGGSTWSTVGTVSSASSLLLADNASTRLYFSPAADYSGSSTSALTLRAWDQTSGTAGTKVSTVSTGGTTAFSSATDVIDVTVTPVNDAPVITSNGGGVTAVVSVPENSTAVTTVTSTDVGGPTAIYSISGGADATKFVIDSSTGVLSFVAAPDYETPTDVGGDNIYDVTVQVSDGALTDSQDIAVTVFNANEPPVVTSAALTLNEGQTVTLSGANFGITDPDSSSFTYTVSSISGGYFQLSTAAGVPVTSFNSADLAGGLVQFVDDGNEVAPAFSVRVNDGTFDSNTLAATITYTPVNDAPTTTPVTLAPIAEDSGARQITQAELLANASDVDGPSLTATGLGISSGAGTLVDNGDGTWTYTPALNDDTSVSFSYSVTDGSLSAAGSASLDITPVNDAPAVTPVDLGGINEDGSRLITQGDLLTGASDGEGDTLTAINLVVVSGSGALTDNGNGTWTFNPTTNWNGSAAFSFETSDGAATTPNIASLTVVPVNGAPVITANTLDITEGDTVVLDNTHLNASDVEQGPAQLTYTISNITHGQFEWAATPGVAITGFTQADVDAGLVVFVHDASDIAPSYDVSVSDGTLSQGPQAATINFTPVNEGINVTGLSGTTTTEAGGTVTFDVALNSQPFADVTIVIVSGNPAEGTASVSSLTFTSSNWNTAQKVTVTRVNDFVADGDQTYSVQLQPATSTDRNYSGLDAADVALTNLDDDTAGIKLTPTSGLVTSESGASDNFSIVLTSQPLADVVIDLSSSNTAEGVLSIGAVVFTSSNWNIPQVVTVTGVNDTVNDGNVLYQASAAPASSGDPLYSGMMAGTVSITNLNVTPTTTVGPGPDILPPPPVLPVDEAGAPEAPKPAAIETIVAPAPSVILQPDTGLNAEGSANVSDADKGSKITAPRLIEPIATLREILTDSVVHGDALLRLLDIINAEYVSPSGGSNTVSPTIHVEIVQDESFLVEVLSQGARVTTASLSIGAIWWALRAGGLMTSLLTSMPAWRTFDLLPVLSRVEDEDDEDSWGFNAAENDKNRALHAEEQAT